MTKLLTRSIPAAVVLAALSMPGAMAQDAMSSDAMGGEAMMSEDELTQCLEQAGAITLPQVAAVAEQGCHDVHNAAMGGNAMGGDAMEGDAMKSDSAM
jgi:hypothetical protein